MEVVSLRKACHEKDQSLKVKDYAIEICNYFLFTEFVWGMILCIIELLSAFVPADVSKESGHLN